MVIWCLILLSFFPTIVRVHGQLDNLGFISIDCGLPEKSSYVDNKTNLEYTSDEQFIDTGTNYNISNEYVRGASLKQFLNVRSFPTGTRNCYTLKSIVAGKKYVVRALFLYGNYDGLNKPPLFDLYIGINFWKTVNASDEASGEEVTTVAQTDYLQVCLVNTGLGTPYISGLELRPLKDVHYPAVTALRSAVLYSRLNMGPKEDSDLIIRYPDDPYDRYWIPWNKVLSRPPGLTEISTTSPIRHLPVDHYDAPSAVIQTALTPKNASKIEYHWTSDAQGKDPGFLIVLYFSEFQTVQGDAKREFDIYLNGIQWADPFSPDYLYSDALFNDKPAPRYPRYNLSIVATSKSTLPPIINALELFRVLDITGNGTDRGDVSAMIAIKETYQLKKSWNGDPCAPRAFAWDGLNCSYAISTPPRITTVNLSSSGLTGGISISFGSLAALQYLDLSHNNLTGSIPDVLAQLSSLVFLDLTDNQLNGSIPAGLLKKSQDGLLTLRIGENLCANDSSCMPPSGETDSMNPSIVIVPVVVLLFLIVILTIYIMRKRKACHQQDTSLKLEIRRFRYKELEVITKNFTQQIGKGGFGKVYGGFLEDGTQVAVKLHSQSSKQGVKEFVTEAKYLARVHHKYLLSMIGYCNNGGHLGLVYEYMSGGTLESHLRGACSTSPLTWKQRLHIALESAEGLEYLHNGCKPQIIHRDIKTSNILLDQNLGAKIADFGMSKDIGIESSVNAAPRVVGTKGYLDPEYCITGIVTEKSDVYSFGVVLLEMITGQPPILDQSEVAHITQWVNQRLNRGTIDNVIDIAMKGNYNPDCVWNVAELAFECTKRAPSQRPTMTVVVMQLQECLELENFVERNHHMPSGSRNPHSRIDEPNRD